MWCLPPTSSSAMPGNCGGSASSQSADLRAADVLLGHVLAEGDDGGAHGVDVELGEAPVERDAAEAEGVALVGRG